MVQRFVTWQGNGGWNGVESAEGTAPLCPYEKIWLDVFMRNAANGVNRQVSSSSHACMVS